MSDDEINDLSATSNTSKHKNPRLVRKSFTPISERMKRNQSSELDSDREPVRSSPRSPARGRKNQSTKPSVSPKTNKRSPRQQKNKLYPDLSANDDDNDEEELDGSDIDDEINDQSYEDDSVDEYRGSTPIIKRYVRKEPYRSTDEPRHMGKREYNRQRRLSPQRETSAQAQYDVIRLFILVFGLLAIAVGLYLYLNQKPSDDIIDQSVDFYKLFIPHFEKIREKYPSQTKRFWKVIHSSIKRLLTEKVETYPAVMLLGIPRSSSMTGTCISKDIVKSLNDVFNSTLDGYIYSGSLNSNTAGKMKQDLDEKLIKNLENGKGVVLDHIEKLPAQVALLLHGYCDGDNAPYKSAAIILGMHVDSVDSLKDEDTLIEGFLNDLWEKDLGIDEMPALRSRIANSVTVVNPEPNLKC